MEDIINKCSKLDDNFTFWFHNPNDTNWALDSYHEILNFSTVEEFWVLHNLIKKQLVENGMFFLMKDGIQPIWEDESNINGGCISFKIDKKSAYQEWEDILIHLISGNFNSNVNGVSISPKKNFNILKLWLSDEINIDQYKLPDTLRLSKETILFRSHKVNIEKDKLKKFN